MKRDCWKRDGIRGLECSVRSKVIIGKHLQMQPMKQRITNSNSLTSNFRMQLILRTESTRNRLLLITKREPGKVEILRMEGEPFVVRESN